MNACYNCVDRHVLAGNGDKVAIIHDSPTTNTIRHVTYKELYDTTARIAGGLQKLGVKKGKIQIINFASFHRMNLIQISSIFC